MPLILPSNSISAIGYEVDNSLRFDDGSSDYLSWTPSSAPTSSRIATISFWFKLSAIGTNFNFFSANQSGLTFPSSFKILLRDSNGRLELQQDDGSAGNHFSLRTNQLLRDASAWYHLVASYDTTQATASNRIKLYINGSQVTSFSQEDYPTQNLDLWLGDTDAHNVGRDVAYGSSYYDGSIAHFHYTDGTAYDASAFGETDATTGIWKPKTAPSVTYGTNGFFLKFENSGAFGTDSSGNANNFTVNGSMTQTIDTPSNVFCTVNPLSIASEGSSTSTLSNGNLTITSSGTSQNPGTLASSIDSNSKWYYEFKCGSGATSIDSSVGWATDVSAFRSGSWATLNSLFLYSADGRLYGTSGWTAPSTAPTYTNGDIIGCTVDLENNEIKWYKNNSLAYTISSISFVGDVITPFSQWSESGAIGYFNFGNGYFGTTAVSSAENPDDGIGIFEYAVPSGYRALCTKSINAQEYD